MKSTIRRCKDIMTNLRIDFGLRTAYTIPGSPKDCIFEIHGALIRVLDELQTEKRIGETAYREGLLKDGLDWEVCGEKPFSGFYTITFTEKKPCKLRERKYSGLFYTSIAILEEDRATLNKLSSDASVAERRKVAVSEMVSRMVQLWCTIHGTQHNQEANNGNNP